MDQRVLIRSGADSAEIFGNVRGHRLGVGITSGGLDIRIDGQHDGKAADLVAALPVQAIHTEIGELVHGPPEVRRRILDWGVFHVEQRYLDHWRRYRRALLQRNAALRDGGGNSAIEVWDAELATAGETLDRLRRDYIARLVPGFRRIGATVVNLDVDLRYLRGWADGQSLLEVLRAQREGDQSAGFTRAGPHRADLVFEMGDLRSRWRASKGQQKLIGAAVVLAQCEIVASDMGREVALVVDEPAADLDTERLASLLTALQQSPAQIFVAAISGEGLPGGTDSRVFHVEHGEVKLCYN